MLMDIDNHAQLNRIRTEWRTETAIAQKTKELKCDLCIENQSENSYCDM